MRYLEIFEDIFKSRSACVPLALLRVTETDPDEVQNVCMATRWSERRGMNSGQIIGALERLGYGYKERYDLVFRNVHDKESGRKSWKPRTLNNLMKVIPDEGRFLVSVRGHTIAVIDGKLYDDEKFGLKHQVHSVLEVFPK